MLKAYPHVSWFTWHFMSSLLCSSPAWCSFFPYRTSAFCYTFLSAPVPVFCAESWNVYHFTFIDRNLDNINFHYPAVNHFIHFSSKLVFNIQFYSNSTDVNLFLIAYCFESHYKACLGQLKHFELPLFQCAVQTKLPSCNKTECRLISCFSLRNN